MNVPLNKGWENENVAAFTQDVSYPDVIIYREIKCSKVYEHAP